MSSQTLRSVCSRARPELVQTGRPLRNYFRSFSTTQSQLDEAGSGSNDGSNKPSSVRQRGRDAATAINSLLNKGAQSGARPQKPAGAQQQSQQQPKVLDIKSLPRGIGRGNRFTPRGGAASTVRGGAQGGRPTTSRFSRGGAAGASRGRGGVRGGRGRGGGARGGRGRGQKKDEDGKANAPGLRGVDPFERMDAAETELDNAMRFGVTETYEPKMDVNSVLEFAPSSGINGAGRRAAVLQELSTLGAAEQVGTPKGLVARHHAENLERQGVMFFASPADKAAAETYLQNKKKQEQQKEGAEGEGDAAAKTEEPTQPIITGAEESLRQVVLDSAVAGKHEAPAFATDLHSIVRSLQLRSGSYKAKDMSAFMAKLEKLAGPPKAAAPEPAAKPAEAKTKTSTAKKTTKKEAAKEAPKA
ncbi:hypothetical protein K4F52_009623 [Lecanicillium sp. MT-2017a]|nr:hypothetical protein K4F52_009623 [Lecanicillium sp. MT-2017a]